MTPKDKTDPMDPWFAAQHGGRAGQSAQGDKELHSPDWTDETGSDDLGEDTAGEGDTFQPQSWSGTTNEKPEKER